MNINVFHTSDGAKQARGLTVIIDVFRAFTTECYVANNGARQIIPVGDLATAYALKANNPDYILMGEQHGEKMDNFDFGNSPYEISTVDFTGKSVIHISTAGTKGLSSATNASEIVTGSFVNMHAIVKYIQARQPSLVSLVCTGTANETILDEDALCAKFIKNSLQGRSTNFTEIVNHLKQGGYIDRFLDPKIPKYPIQDVDFCLQLDKFDFVLKASPYLDHLHSISRISL